MSWGARLAALLALVCQLVLAQPVVAAEATQMHVCSTEQHQAPAHHHDMDCLRCSLCAMVVHAALTPPQAPLPTPPSRPVTIRMRLPAARAPPGRTLLAAYPRGPPRLA